MSYLILKIKKDLDWRMNRLRKGVCRGVNENFYVFTGSILNEYWLITVILIGYNRGRKYDISV